MKKMRSLDEARKETVAARKAELDKMIKTAIPSGGVATGGYTCMGCGKWVNNFEIHACTSYTPYTPTPTKTVPYAPLVKDINWKEYTAAKPPITGKYLIVVVHPGTAKRETYFSDYNSKTYEWSDCPSGWLVTHYARIELP